MSALPADPLPETATAAQDLASAPYRSLPRIPDHAVQMRDLITVRGIADLHETSRSKVRAVLALDGAPQPVGERAVAYRNQHEALYRAVEVQRFIDSVAGADGSISRRRRSHPVRVIGTRTPSVGRPYTWRDPARQQPARVTEGPRP